MFLRSKFLGSSYRVGITIPFGHESKHDREAGCFVKFLFCLEIRFTLVTSIQLCGGFVWGKDPRICIQRTKLRGQPTTYVGQFELL